MLDVMSHVLARCNGTEIVDHDGERWIVQKRSPPHLASAALALLAFIMIVNGLVQAVMGGRPLWHNAVAAGILLTVGLVCVWIRRALLRLAAQWATQEVGPSWILADGKLLDGKRRELAALGDLRCKKVFQVFSSSKALALVWPSGNTVIARGNPFGDSVHGCEQVLQSLGITAA